MISFNQTSLEINLNFMLLVTDLNPKLIINHFLDQGNLFLLQFTNNKYLTDIFCWNDRKSDTISKWKCSLPASKVHYNNGPDLFVQLSVFVKFIGFPKTGYLDITAVCHDIHQNDLHKIVVKTATVLLCPVATNCLVKLSRRE